MVCAQRTGGKVKPQLKHLETLWQKLFRWARNFLLLLIALLLILFGILFRDDLILQGNRMWALLWNSLESPTLSSARVVQDPETPAMASDLLTNQQHLFDYSLQGAQPEREQKIKEILKRSHSFWRVEGPTSVFVKLVLGKEGAGKSNSTSPIEGGVARTLLLLLPGESLTLSAKDHSTLEGSTPVPQGKIRLSLKMMGVTADRQDLKVPLRVETTAADSHLMDPKGSSLLLDLAWNGTAKFTMPEDAPGFLSLESLHLGETAAAKSEATAAKSETAAAKSEAAAAKTEAGKAEGSSWVILWNLPNVSGLDSEALLPLSAAALKKINGPQRTAKLERLIPESDSRIETLRNIFQSNDTSPVFWSQWGKMSSAEWVDEVSDPVVLGQSQLTLRTVADAAPEFSSFRTHPAQVKMLQFDFASWSLSPSLGLLKALPLGLWPAHLGKLLQSQVRKSDEREEKLQMLDTLLARAILDSGPKRRWIVLGLKESMPEVTASQPDEPQSFAWISDSNWNERDRSYVRLMPLQRLSSLFSEAGKWTSQSLENWLLSLRDEANWALKKDQKGYHFFFPRAYYHVPFGNPSEILASFADKRPIAHKDLYSVPFLDWKQVRSRVDRVLESSPKSLMLLFPHSSETQRTLLLVTGQEITACQSFPQQSPPIMFETLQKKQSFETRIQTKGTPLLLRCALGASKTDSIFDVVAEENGLQVATENVAVGGESLSFARALASSSKFPKDSFNWTQILMSETPPETPLQGTTPQILIWMELSAQSPSPHQ